jgi:AraC-like DNA-binding protein
MEAFSTHDVPAARKLAYWNALNSEVFTALEVRADDAGRFEGSLRRRPVGTLTALTVHSAAAHIVHTRRHIQSAQRASCLLMTPLRGVLEVQDRSQPAVRVAPGELCLLDHTEPYGIRHGDDTLTLCVDLPHAELQRVAPDYRGLVGQLIRPDSPTARLLNALLRELGNEVQRPGSVALPLAVADSLLALLGPVCPVPAGRLRGTALRDQLLQWIDRHLTDPALSPAQVAAAFGISQRHLRGLLADSGHRFGNHVLEGRLALAAARLRDPQWSGRGILQVALACGFTNATHFGQAFRRRHGQSPRAWRHDH